jgi:DNA-binding FadR family transcriptional regulator
MKLTVSDAELARALKPAKGAPPRAQVRVMRAILEAWGLENTGPMPNLAEIGRLLGIRRQVVSEAIRGLKRKGILAIIDAKEPVVTHRTVRKASFRLPDTNQPELPLGEPPCPVCQQLAAAA